MQKKTALESDRVFRKVMGFHSVKSGWDWEGLSVEDLPNFTPAPGSIPSTEETKTKNHKKQWLDLSHWMYMIKS
jgi:hypothetical protein